MKKFPFLWPRNAFQNLSIAEYMESREEWVLKISQECDTVLADKEI
ncbi:hypothetical protein ES705_25200 [subsurface metagenome]